MPTQALPERRVHGRARWWGLRREEQLGQRDASQRSRAASDVVGSARELRVGATSSSSSATGGVAKEASPLASSSSASAMEVEGLAKLQQGLTKAPEAVAAAKDAEQAALKELSGSAAETTTTTGGAAVEPGAEADADGVKKSAKLQSDQVVDDPLWQYFYLTAMSHKINKPLLAEIPLTTQDLLGLFYKAKADENLTFDRWPSWLIKEMTGLSMALGYEGVANTRAEARENAVPAVDKRQLLAGGDFFTFEKTKMKGVMRKKMLLQISKDLSTLNFGKWAKP